MHADAFTFSWVSKMHIIPRIRARGKYCTESRNLAAIFGGWRCPAFKFGH
jgi:hypothetical protein